MKIFTLGNGFIANHLPYPKITYRLTPNQQDMYDVLQSLRQGGVLINCIGRCGSPNVDWCESHKEETYESNVVIPLMIADWCKQFDVHLINIGSGCVYFGKSPNYYLERHGDPHYCEDTISRVDAGWNEDNFANPQSYYSKTKYACDLVLGQLPHVTTLRIRMPISNQDTSRNLINKLRGYSKVIDIPNSVTFMDDLVRCIDWTANNRPSGIFHVANSEPLTAAQIMREYQKYVPSHKFDIITEQQLDQMVVAKRSNCVLSNKKLTNAGFTMTDTQQALKQCMVQYISNIGITNNV
jgi:3,5-epimerase/4-reductase